MNFNFKYEIAIFMITKHQKNQRLRMTNEKH